MSLPGKIASQRTTDSVRTPGYQHDLIGQRCHFPVTLQCGYILQLRDKTRYTRWMTTRIELDDSVADIPTAPWGQAEPPPPSSGRDLVDADWDGSHEERLMLYLSDEPAMGHEFSYNGVRWRIIDYRDGWVARLLV